MTAFGQTSKIVFRNVILGLFLYSAVPSVSLQGIATFLSYLVKTLNYLL